LVEPPTYLIVNADDFGFSPGVNRGVAEAHESGIVTCASLMVKQPAADEAAHYARRQTGLDVGLHLEFERRPARRLLWKRSRPAETAPREAVAAEAGAQLARFRDLLGQDPSHLDSHQHRHRYEPARSVLLGLAEELGVPLREADPRIRFCGDFYGQMGGRPWPEGIRPASLVRLIESLTPGVTELCTHPGYADDLDQRYKTERALEVQALCHASVRAAVERLGIRLVTFRQLNMLD
jgi:predicted glycoside hydrolase/deacetylase ChbG (UPF0249 family)